MFAKDFCLLDLIDTDINGSCFILNISSDSAPEVSHGHYFLFFGMAEASHTVNTFSFTLKQTWKPAYSNA